ncbi:MAG: B12-binding domain-containing radical SAM protein [Gemmatimonadetes bacterium]|nr:B12-binding domain-containing radical SAM protein [Gemmatimonadota bacterium]
MKPKVVLYNPVAEFYTMPLALLAIGSHLDRERYQPVIVDGRLKHDPASTLVSAVEGAVCLGITVLTGAPIRDAIRISRIVKAARPDLPIVWGGWHPSMFGDECLDEASVDVTVQGQGEVTFAEIVDRLSRGESLEGCRGCTYRRPAGPPARQPARPLEDINTFRPHDYSLLKVEHYYDLKGKYQLDYTASQGCRFRCSFCADPFVFERRWVGLAPERIGEEIETLWRRYRFTDVNFQDETFFTSAPRVQAIAEEFIRRRLPITWAATMRADQCARLDDAVLETCRRSGLRRVLVGVESGSPEMLKRIQKDITIEQVLETAARCLAHGIRVRFPFIVGFPEEDEQSVSDTLNLAKRLRAMSPDFEAVIFYFKPYPGSAITQEAVARGHRLPRSLDEWSDFDYVGSAGPWVTAEKYRKVERFKFYQELAWDRVPTWKQPFQRLAQWRCRRDAYGFPVERVAGRWLAPRAGLP